MPTVLASTPTNDVHEGGMTFSPSIYICLAQLQGPFRPLFPSLRRLRILEADTSLDYLRLFLSPSLESLEVTGIPDDRQATFHAFISAPVDAIPTLSTLVFGPGHLPIPVLITCLRFYHLKHLTLVDAVASFDCGLLEDLGQLKFLESLTIDTAAASYTSSGIITIPGPVQRSTSIKELSLSENETTMATVKARSKRKCEICHNTYKSSRSPCPSCRRAKRAEELTRTQLDSQRSLRRKMVVVTEDVLYVCFTCLFIFIVLTTLYTVSTYRSSLIYGAPTSVVVQQSSKIWSNVSAPPRSNGLLSEWWLMNRPLIWTTRYPLSQRSTFPLSAGRTVLLTSASTQVDSPPPCHYAERQSNHSFIFPKCSIWRSAGGGLVYVSSTTSAAKRVLNHQNFKPSFSLKRAQFSSLGSNPLWTLARSSFRCGAGSR